MDTNYKLMLHRAEYSNYGAKCEQVAETEASQ